MNLNDIKNKIKPYFTVDMIWKMELVFGILFLAIFMAFDFWIYDTYVRGGFGEASAPEVATLLKKSAIEKAANKIKSQKDFLENPSFGVVKNPF